MKQERVESCYNVPINPTHNFSPQIWDEIKNDNGEFGRDTSFSRRILQLMV